MTPEAIHSFLEKEKPNSLIKIEFKKRNVLKGMIVRMADFEDLSVKNFWRIVPEANIEKWTKKPDNNLLRIYSGSEFTKLTSTVNGKPAKKLAEQQN
jgi:hypothetical protein